MSIPSPHSRPYSVHDGQQRRAVQPAIDWTATRLAVQSHDPEVEPQLRYTVWCMAEVAVLGAGGHAGVIIQLLRASKREVAGVYDDGKEAQLKGKLCFTVRPMSGIPQGSAAVIAIGSNAVRLKVDARFPGMKWATLVHPSAVNDPSATLGSGTVVMAGAVIQAGARVGRHVVVNTRCSVDHDLRYWRLRKRRSRGSSLRHCCIR